MSSNPKALLACYGQCLVPDLNVMGVLQSEMKPDTTSTRTEALQSFPEDKVWAGICAGLLGKGPTALGLRQAC